MALWLAVAACGGSTPPPDAPPPPPIDEGEEDGEELPASPEAIETGKDCATAEALCDAGICKATIHNKCPQPITCELELTVICRTETETGEAKGANRGTIAANSTNVIEAAGNCQGAMMVATTADSLSCQ